MPREQEETVEMLYGFKRRLKNLLERIEKSEEIDENSKEVIMKFYLQLASEGISASKIYQYLLMLIKLVKMTGKPLASLTKEDLQKFVAWLETESGYKAWTKITWKAMLKKFFKWLRGTSDYPEEVAWIKTGMKRRDRKLPDEILTQEDIKKLAEAADNIRDKAIVLTLYESGARAAEFLGMRIKDVRFDDFGAKVVLIGKTGMRVVRLVMSAPALRRWLDVHPLKDDRNAYLWVSYSTNMKNQPLGHRGLVKLLKKLAEKAGINKPVNPHAFRHARATHLANVLTEHQMKVYFGWTPSSKMSAVYVHLSGRDIDNALLSYYGIVKQKKEDALKPILCPRCGTPNEPASSYCYKCGFPLTPQAFAQYEANRVIADRIMNLLFQDEEFVEFVKRKLIELKATGKLEGIKV